MKGESSEMHTEIINPKDVKEYNGIPLEELIYSNESLKNIIIRFDKLFDRDDIKFVNDFRISKRAYYKTFDLIVSDLKIMLLNYPNYFVTMLKYRYEISVNKNKEAAQKIIKEEIVENDEIYEVVTRFVEATYTQDLDSLLDSRKNQDYAIDDKMNKNILKSSIVMRLLLPFLTLPDYKCGPTEIYNNFVKVVNTFSGNKNTYFKLSKFIELRVRKTIYSDKIIWRFLEKHSKNPNIEIRKLTISIIGSIITKIDYDKRTTSFLDVVLREKLHNLFTYNNTLNIKSIKSTTKELEEKERMEINLNKKDPSELYLQELAIEQEVKGVTITDEYAYLKDISNEYTDKFLRIYYNDVCDTLFANKEQRVKLIIKMRNELLNLGYKILPEILLCDINKNVRRGNIGKKLNNQILASKKYQEFIEKYSDIKLLLNEKSNLIISLVTLKNNILITKDGETYDLDSEALSNEVLDLLI